ncbi:MAG: TrbC/VirB2 family protein [Candidatus Peregrinibacteria bacterium]
MIRPLLFISGLLAPATAYAQGTSTPLGEVTNFGELVSLVWAYGSQIIIGLAIFFVILGAFFYVTSAGNDERVSQGKQMVFGALVAIVLVLSSGILMRLLHEPAQGTTGALAEVPKVLQNATTILAGLISAFAILMLAYAGILYITGRGEAEKLEKAHNAFRYAIYGLVIGVSAYAIVNTVINLLI